MWNLDRVDNHLQLCMLVRDSGYGGRVNCRVEMKRHLSNKVKLGRPSSGQRVAQMTALRARSLDPRSCHGVGRCKQRIFELSDIRLPLDTAALQKQLTVECGERTFCSGFSPCLSYDASVLTLSFARLSKVPTYC